MTLHTLYRIPLIRKYWLALALTALLSASAWSGLAQATPFSEPGVPYLVKDINPTGPSNPRNLVVMNGMLYFVTDFNDTETIWKSDGSDAGTVPLKSFTSTRFNNLINELTASGGTLYFSADADALTYDLWKSDGSVDGTVLVREFGPGLTNYSPLQNLTDVNGTLFFGAREDDGVMHLWKSNGTPEGTVLVKGGLLDIDTTTSRFIRSGNLLYFVGSSMGSTPIYKLWQSDGTEPGTQVSKFIPNGTPPNEHFVYNMLPIDWVDVDGVLYFRGNAGSGWQLWRSNGTPEGTLPVSADIMYPQYLTQIGSRIFFAQDTALWTSDGTPEGTLMVKDSITPLNLVNVNGTLFFSGNDGVNGRELWKSDGTSAGTEMVLNINPSVIPSGGVGSFPAGLTAVNGLVYFSATDGTHGYELWKSDGTPTGTVMVKDLHPSGNAGIASLTLINNLLFFVANDGTYSFELWAMDITRKSQIFLPFVLR